MNQIFQNIGGTDFAECDRHPMVSIIIAAYNAEGHVERALTSCARQTYRNLEIIVVDDGSEDQTAEIVRAMAECDPRVLLISKPNGGQGIARNQAIDVATGEFITIVDADDELQERAIEVMVKQALLTRADLVVGMMTHILPDGRSLYQPMFDGKKIDLFSVNERRRLLKETYFTQGRLYRKAMLDENNVRYGEGYIYEDVEFVLGSVLFSKRISTIPNPVYRLRVTEGSTTRAKHNTDWHSESFAKAVAASVQKYGGELNEVADAFVTYVLNRTMAYVRGGRVGRQFKRKFYKDITRSLRSLKDDYNGARLSGVNARSLSFSKFSPTLGFVFLLAQRQTVVFLKRPAVAQVLTAISQMFAPVLDPVKVRRSRRRKTNLRAKALAEGFNNNMVLFHGFDGEIRGNTKYVLEEFSSAGFDCYVVSKTSKVVPGVKVIKLWSEEFHRIAAKARFHVLETWGSLGIGKYPGAVWIQMWHGTPLKQLLLDSPEVDISKTTPKHAMMKLRDIARWDWLIAQNDFCKRALSSAFAYDSDKIKVYGYPRIAPLFDEATVAEKKAFIRHKYRVPNGKKVLLYAETWRDYNHKAPKKDFSYQVDWSLLPEEFMEEYHVLHAGHPFGVKKTPAGVVSTSGDDFQDLLAAADALITDYSSALFDYIGLGRPFCLFMKDFERYQRTRGLYSEPLADLKKFIAYDESAIASILAMGVDSSDRAIIDKYSDAGGGNAAAGVVKLVEGIRQEIVATPLNN